MNLDPLSRDLVVRTLYGEAAQEPDEGLAAVAHVIRNRLGAGTYGPNVRSVVLAPNQFEPWNTDQGRARMKGLSPDSPEYQRIARIVDGAWGGNVPDPTNGAQFFYAPAAQRALGRQDPAWATPERFVTQIGGHAFYAAPGAQRAQAAPAGRGALPQGAVLIDAEPAQQAPQRGALPAGAVLIDAEPQQPPAAQPPQAATAQPAASPAEAEPMGSRVADAFGDIPIGQQPGQATPRQLRDASERINSPPVETSIPTRLVIAQENMMRGAEQRTSPDPSRYGAPIGAEVAPDDGGNMTFRNRITGRAEYIDPQRHVLLIEPNSGRAQVYFRQPENEEQFAGPARVLSQGLAGISSIPRVAAPSAMRAGQEATAAAARVSVPLPRGVASDNIAVQQAANVERNIPWAGAPVVRSFERAVQATGQAADDVARGLGGQGRQAAGETAGRSIREWITGASRETTRRAYDAVDAAVDPNVRTELGATRSAIAEIANRNTQAGLPPGRAIDVVQDAVQRAGGLTYQGIKDLRTRVGEMLDTGLLPEGMSQAELRRIYGSLTDDLRNAVQAGGGARGVQLWERANRANQLVAQRREDLARIVGAGGDAPAEQVFDRLVAAASDRGRANMSLLAQARRVMSGEDWNEVAGAVVQRLGRDAEGAFQPGRFLTAWGRLTPEGRTMLFGQNSPHARALNDIATVSSRLQQFDRFGNPSGSGRVVSGAAAGAGAIADPLTTLVTLGSNRLVAEWLARPATASSVARWGQAYERAITNPTPRAISAYEIASRNLANTAGMEHDAQAFLRLLQPPSQQQQPPTTR